MSRREQPTMEDVKNTAAIDILPAEDLKKPAEVTVDFAAPMQKAIRFDIKAKRKAGSKS